ncbi:hypothetical protein V8E36_004585 [Tilletia maclaganii]
MYSSSAGLFFFLPLTITILLLTFPPNAISAQLQQTASPESSLKPRYGDTQLNVLELALVRRTTPQRHCCAVVAPARTTFRCPIVAIIVAHHIAVLHHLEVNWSNVNMSSRRLKSRRMRGSKAGLVKNALPGTSTPPRRPLQALRSPPQAFA